MARSRFSALATDDFYHSRLDQMIDLRHPLAVPALRIPWLQIEAALAAGLAHKNRVGTLVAYVDLFGPSTQLVHAGVSPTGRPRLSIRPTTSLLYVKHAFNLSDEEFVERWAENMQWQYFSSSNDSGERTPQGGSDGGWHRSEADLRTGRQVVAPLRRSGRLHEAPPLCRNLSER